MMEGLFFVVFGLLALFIVQGCIFCFMRARQSEGAAIS